MKKKQQEVTPDLFSITENETKDKRVLILPTDIPDALLHPDFTKGILPISADHDYAIELCALFIYNLTGGHKNPSPNYWRKIPKSSMIADFNDEERAPLVNAIIWHLRKKHGKVRKIIDVNDQFQPGVTCKQYKLASSFCDNGSIEFEIYNPISIEIYDRINRCRENYLTTKKELKQNGFDVQPEHSTADNIDLTYTNAELESVLATDDILNELYVKRAELDLRIQTRRDEICSTFSSKQSDISEEPIRDYFNETCGDILETIETEFDLETEKKPARVRLLKLFEDEQYSNTILNKSKVSVLLCCSRDNIMRICREDPTINDRIKEHNNKIKSK